MLTRFTRGKIGSQVGAVVLVAIAAMVLCGNAYAAQWNHTNVSYGPEARQWMNIAVPGTASPSGIFFWAHANGGTPGSLTQESANAMLDNGYAVVSWGSVGQLQSQSDIETGWADAQVVFDYVRANAATWNMDPDNIIVGGRSRGSVVSWKLAQGADPAIVGIYMYNALPAGVWGNPWWHPANDVTVNAPPTYLAYGPEWGSSDSHAPENVDPVDAAYTAMGIGDRFTLYQDMWGDFQDGNGNWTNAYWTSHYLPELIASLAQTTTGYDSLFIGHSFFIPVANGLPFHAALAGFGDHTQNTVFSGGGSGSPIALWEDPVHRAEIQAFLDSGTVELFGMTYASSGPTTEGYENWIDYALAQNPNTRFSIGLPWADFPESTDAATYASSWLVGHDTGWHDFIDEIRALYPGVDIFCIPYGRSSHELRNLYAAGNLPDVATLVSSTQDSIYNDAKGHADGILIDLAVLVWLNAIYGVDLNAYAHDPGYSTDLKAIAQTIMDEHNAAFGDSEPVPALSPGGLGVLALAFVAAARRRLSGRLQRS